MSDDAPLRSEDSVHMIMLVLACTLAALRDRLFEDGHDRAAEVIADLVEITDDYLDRIEV